MELKIAANDMLTILMDSGIDETDAKAIIFDIIQIQDAGTEERNKLIEVRREREKARKAPRKVFKTKTYDTDDLEEDEDEEGEVELEASPAPRKSKRVNFSNFGGDAPPLK